MYRGVPWGPGGAGGMPERRCRGILRAMLHRHMRLLAPAILVLAACAEPAPTLDEVRAATSKYASVEAALADGYVRDPMDVCETSYYLGSLRDEGTVGIHFF